MRSFHTPQTVVILEISPVKYKITENDVKVLSFMASLFPKAEKNEQRWHFSVRKKEAHFAPIGISPTPQSLKKSMFFYLGCWTEQLLEEKMSKQKWNRDLYHKRQKMVPSHWYEFINLNFNNMPKLSISQTCLIAPI